jgi:hypothetical protein
MATGTSGQSVKLPNELPDICWEGVYSILDMEAEHKEALESLKIGESEGFWVIPVIRGVTCKKVINALQSTGVVVTAFYSDLDIAVHINDRDPNRDGTYLVGFHKGTEADKENIGMSANRMRENGRKGITLLERLLLELGYYVSTGQHLDQHTVTLCAGSRSNDRPLCVRWFPDERGLCVYCTGPNYPGDITGARSVLAC